MNLIPMGVPDGTEGPSQKQTASTKLKLPSKVAGMVAIVDADHCIASSTVPSSSLAAIAAEPAARAAADALLIPKPTVIEAATTARTLLLTDAWNFIKFTNADPVVVTVPLFEDVAFEVGTKIELCQFGGSLSVVGDDGVNVITSRTATAFGQFAVMVLRNIGEDEWILSGDTAPEPEA